MGALSDIANQGFITSYKPSLREIATDWLARNLYSDNREGVRKAEKLVNIAEFSPFGALTAANDFGRAVGSGDYKNAALMGAMAAIPLPAPVENEIRKEAQTGIRAFHGSPHSFDRFSMDKIGTGEGAQAYGHGLYFAENEGVAKGYRDTLTASKNALSNQAKKILPKLDGIRDISVSARPGQAIPEVRINGRVRSGDEISYAAEKVFEQKGSVTVQDLKDYFGARNDIAPGSMYEVRINANPDDFLDWDKPLSEQPANVKDAINRVGRNVDQYGLDRITDDMRGVEMKRLLTDPQGTKGLLEAGIPGIKYLDAGSRGTGDGFRNYVVFDDKLIDIVRKYGLAGLALGLGYTQTPTLQSLAQPQPQEF